MRVELREKESVIEDLNEQIKKLQDVLIEYAKVDDETQIVRYNGTSDDNQALILKDPNAKKNAKQVFSLFCWHQNKPKRKKPVTPCALICALRVTFAAIDRKARKLT